MDFSKWFPLAAKCRAPQAPPCRMRLLCFHGAGSDSNIFVTKGTAKNPMPNPLLEFCTENDIELLPVHLPGRTIRIREMCITSIVEIARAVLDVLVETRRVNATHSSDEVVPLIVAAHSMGCLCAYEFMKQLNQRKLQRPALAFFSCMISPDIPTDARPWRSSKGLDTAALQAECRGWAVNEILFEPEMWSIYEKIIRADFQAFDEYSVSPDSENPLRVPLRTFSASKDNRATKERMAGWGSLVCGSDADSKHFEITGTHGMFYDADARAQWMKIVTDEIDLFILRLEYG